MHQDFIVFDLDGTISDPKDGIVRSINFALEAHGYSARAESELVKYIGPPLDIAFQELSGSQDKEHILSLVSKYRERYSAIGFSENSLYEGIVECLESLATKKSLAICTSKRVDFAKRILDLFEIRHLFEVISGGDIGISKTQQLSELLETKAIGKHSIMVGDRDADLIGANNNKLGSVGVLWGYGDYLELSQHNPLMILEDPSQMGRIIT
jgi:phosphoglycolate phosphatase